MSSHEREKELKPSYNGECFEGFYESGHSEFSLQPSMICSDLLLSSLYRETEETTSQKSEPCICENIIVQEQMQLHDRNVFLQVGNVLLAESMNNPNHMPSRFRIFSGFSWIRNLFSKTNSSNDRVRWWTAFGDVDWERIRQLSNEIYPAVERDFFDSGDNSQSDLMIEEFSNQQRNRIDLVVAKLLDDEEEAMSDIKRSTFVLGCSFHEIALVTAIFSVAMSFMKRP